MINEKSEFFDPATCPFEVLGFQEELSHAVTKKFLGTRTVDKLTRPAGSPGMIEYVITENLVLAKGHKTVAIKASKKHPLPVVSMFQLICGHTK